METHENTTVKEFPHIEVGFDKTIDHRRGQQVLPVKIGGELAGYAFTYDRKGLVHSDGSYRMFKAWMFEDQLVEALEAIGIEAPDLWGESHLRVRNQIRKSFENRNARMARQRDARDREERLEAMTHEERKDLEWTIESTYKAAVKDYIEELYAEHDHAKMVRFLERHKSWDERREAERALDKLRGERD